jgi:hypothetical protein
MVLPSGIWERGEKEISPSFGFSAKIFRTSVEGNGREE